LGRVLVTTDGFDECNFRAFVALALTGGLRWALSGLSREASNSVMRLSLELVANGGELFAQRLSFCSAEGGLSRAWALLHFQHGGG
jgi:hypothetical protein